MEHRQHFGPTQPEILGLRSDAINPLTNHLEVRKYEECDCARGLVIVFDIEISVSLRDFPCCGLIPPIVAFYPNLFLGTAQILEYFARELSLRNITI
jgi:hypothetical protein